MINGEKWLPVLFAVSLLLCLIQLNSMLIAASIWLRRKNQPYGAPWVHFP
jgi:hypothetical protein